MSGGFVNSGLPFMRALLPRVLPRLLELFWSALRFTLVLTVISEIQEREGNP
jgi:hypothetical protein